MPLPWFGALLDASLAALSDPTKDSFILVKLPDDLAVHALDRKLQEGRTLLPSLTPASLLYQCQGQGSTQEIGTKSEWMGELLILCSLIVYTCCFLAPPQT